uniref:DNA helicase n=1 Tax=Eptatretus burgeri TaxID=7764 RepID=A0A8C4WWW5_EPTBU
MSLEEFVSRTLDLLKEEREAEVEEARSWQQKIPLKELQKRGVCLLKLQPSNQHTGLYGRTIISFEARKVRQKIELPSNCFGPGDIIGLFDPLGEGLSKQLASGVVTKVTTNYVTIAFEESLDALSLPSEGIFHLLKLANDITYKRLKRTLHLLNNFRDGLPSELISVLFGNSQPNKAPSDAETKVRFVNPALDDSQKEAVVFALNQREVAVVHGPPGTGKTTTVVEIILQAVQQGQKILACAPSNIAVDNLAERLSKTGVIALRLGHPARLLAPVQHLSLDAVLARCDSAAIVHDVRSDIDRTYGKLKKVQDRGERARLHSELKILRKELRGREEAAMRNILLHANVVLASNTGACMDGPLHLLQKDHFGLVVLDESGQAIEASCWMPLLYAPKCVLVGDHLQLPPTVLSSRAAAEGLGTSLLERLVKTHGEKVVRMLRVQYRMNDAIGGWASRQMYNGNLHAHPSVAAHLLRDLPGVEDTEDTRLALLLIDTASCGLHETADEEQSKGNPGEVDIVVSHVESLLKAGVKSSDVAVISPYNLQVHLLRQTLSVAHPGLEVKSVDGFQGREKEAVVLSLVRSNRKGEVGFLNDDRRINVAVTRARRHLAVVCDADTVGSHPFLQSLLDQIEAQGETRTAFEYLDIVEEVSFRPNHDQSVSMNKNDRASASMHTKTAVQVGHIKSARDANTFREKDEVKGEELQQLRCKLEGFVVDKLKQRLEFAASLESSGRLWVHRFAEELGLGHGSVGDGNKRFIAVWKLGESSKSDETTTKEETPQSVNNEAAQEKQSDSTEDVTCKLVTKAVRDTTEKAEGVQVDLKALHMERVKRDKARTQEDKEKNRMGARRKKSGKNIAKGCQVDLVGDEDLDSVVEAFVQLDRTCAFPQCKANVSLVGHRCQHCHCTHCLKHRIPEVCAAHQPSIELI